MSGSIIVITSEKKKRLQKSIEQKKKLLIAWNEKVEMLKMDLELIENEYNVRIGYLLLKDNKLDLELIQLRNLKRLLEEGLTYEEAIKQEEDAFYNDLLRMQEEEEEIKHEQELFEKRKDMTEEKSVELKILWKQLIRQFHPDLVQEPDIKHERERIMKQINVAYAAGDLQALQDIERLEKTISIHEKSMEELEQELVDIENGIESSKFMWTMLRETEWFGWKKKFDKAKKTGEDVFLELEKQLLNDIAKKIDIARKLRGEVGHEVIL